MDGDYNHNTARLINHSCSPNCEVTGKGTKLWISSIRDIKKGEELSYDYGFGFDEYYKDFPVSVVPLIAVVSLLEKVLGGELSLKEKSVNSPLGKYYLLLS